MSDEIVRTVIVDRLVPDLFRRGHPALAACSSVSLPEMDDDYSVGDLSELEAESAAETGKAIGAMSTTPSTDASPEPIPSIRWYHGRLTREEAEQRLGRDGAVGRFIVRESDNRPGNYVLSCIIGERHIMHYPVTFVCGHYFLAGQQFDSLESLVTYHLFSIDKKLPLSEPVEPSSQVLLKSRQRIAILPFSGMPDTDELSFIKGDIFTVHQDLDADWFWATLDRTDESGLVFSGLTEELTNNCVLPSRLPYFHPTDDVQELAGRMAAVGVDSFLVRPSGHVPQAFALMLNTGERIEKFLIRQTDDDRFELGGRRFASVNDIVERYKQTDICDGHRLQVPVLRVDYEAGAPLDRHEVGRVHMKRLSSRSSCPDAVKSGNAWRKTKEQKKWKPVYLMLTDAGGGQLFCFESEKRAKPKLVLDLCYCHLYQIDESLFGRPNCLQLLINGMDQSAVFFCFNGDDDCVEWQSFLKPLCLGYRQSGSPFSSIRNFQTKRSLIRRKHFVQLLVHEAKNLSSKAESQFYCIAVINGAKIARTQSVAASQKSETAVWDASFLLEDIPSGCSTLQFQLRSTQNGKSKDRIVGTTTTVDMSMEKSLVGLTLFPLPAKNAMSRSIYESLGTWQLRVSAERSELLVLPEEEYSSLKELLTANSFALCHWLGCRLNVEKRQRLANALINVFSTGGVYLNLINDELDRELALSGESKSLFRRDSLCSSLISTCMRRLAGPRVTELLRPHVARLLEVKQTFEIETTGDGDSASQNAVLLVSFVQDLCDTIYESAATFPIVVRYILSLVRLKTASQWPDQPTVARRAVNSFVVLRLFSLALVDPRKFNLITGILPRLAGRNLIQAAKLVQTTANLSPPPVVQDNAKPDPIRSFVANSQPRMAAFLEEISSADEEQARIAATQRGGARMDVADDLALIAELTEGAAAGAVDETPVREARMVLELLRKHRDQYCGGGGGGS